MPKRPNTHVVADKAVSQVSEIITNCGFSCEVVHHDYGEDLMVQTKCNDIVDSNKLWIQVKGSEKLDRFKINDDEMALKISLDHAYKWLRSTDMVIVVIWDVTNKQGFWNSPNHLSEWKLKENTSQTTILNFKKKNVFDENALIKLSWEARCSHYNLLLADIKSDEEALDENETRCDVSPLIAIDFIKLLGIIRNNEIDIKYYMIAKKEIKKQMAKGEDFHNAIISAAIVLILNTVMVIAKIGMRHLLLQKCSETLAYLIEQRIRKEQGEEKNYAT